LLSKASNDDYDTQWVNAPNAANGIPAGGLEGQILSKLTDDDYDAEWIDNYAPDTRIVVKNDSGVTLNAGVAVMAVGATGDQIRVAKAVADGSVEPRYMLGVMYETVTNGNSGYMTLTGGIPHLDTGSYTLGDTLYIDPAVPGGFTTTEPSSPELVMPIAIVTRVNSSSGRIFVRMWSQQSGLHELHDVLTDVTPADNEVLAYDSASSLWKNQTASEAGLVPAGFGVPTGAMMMWYTDTAPTGWQICDGSAAATSALIAVIGANVPDLRSRVPVGKKAATSLGTATISIATPAVVTDTGHSLSNGQLVYFTTTGALPTGVVANTRYYVRNTTENTFNLSSTPTGAVINTSGSQSGTHTLFSADFADLGFGSGSVSEVLTINQMPAHNHTPQGTSRFNAGNTSVTRTRFASGTSGGFAFQSGTQSDLLQVASTTTVGGGLEHNNLQPYIVLNYIIKT
jgi:microcystin-dependent protein